MPCPGKPEPEKDRNKFDVDKELSAIPALNLDLFQQRMLNNRLAAKAAAMAAGTGTGGGGHPMVQKRPGSEFEAGVAGSQPQPSAKKKPRKAEQPKQLPNISGPGVVGPPSNTLRA